MAPQDSNGALLDENLEEELFDTSCDCSHSLADAVVSSEVATAEAFRGAVVLSDGVDGDFLFIVAGAGSVAASFSVVFLSWSWLS